jgi:isopentenyl-diphosphate delta-isomerase
MTNIVLVDEKDRVLGLKEKLSAHKIPVPLHRAISIVIFNKDKSKMLITQRAKGKPTWPLFWTNAVCSHPYPDETYQDAAKRRLTEELGISVPLKDVLNFIYSWNMDGSVWGENELDHTFVGEYDGEIDPDPNEVENYEWINISELMKDLKVHPEKYTPWFKIILDKMTKESKILQQ